MFVDIPIPYEIKEAVTQRLRAKGVMERIECKIVKAIYEAGKPGYDENVFVAELPYYKMQFIGDPELDALYFVFRFAAMHDLKTTVAALIEECGQAPVTEEEEDSRPNFNYEDETESEVPQERKPQKDFNPNTDDEYDDDSLHLGNSFTSSSHSLNIAENDEDEPLEVVPDVPQMAPRPKREVVPSIEITSEEFDGGDLIVVL